MSRNLDFRVSTVSVPTLLKVLEAVAAHPNSDAGDVRTFAGVGRSTADRAVAVLLSFGLLTRGSDRGYVCTEPGIKRGVNVASARQYLRRALLTYRPFEAVVEGLALGESVDDAVRKASVLLGLSRKDIGKFEILLKWGVELKLLDSDNGHFALAPEVTPSQTETVPFLASTDVESEAKARLYIARRLGREAYNNLDEKDRGLLAGALLEVSTNPAGAVEKAGQAVENYLREISADKGFSSEASKLNGGSQLASLLVSKTLIHSHQQKLVDSVSMFRNAKAHHKDKKTLTPWHIDEEGAIASFFSALTAVKSIHFYISTGKQIL